MRNVGKAGFTLIELLVVIAIIGILAGMVYVVGSRALMKTRMTSVISDFRNLHTKLFEYYTEHQETYPPAYGYLKWEAASMPLDVLTGLRDTAESAAEDVDNAPLGNFPGAEDVDDNGNGLVDSPKEDFYKKYYYYEPYTFLLGLYHDKLAEDKFSEGYDTDEDAAIAMLEYLPEGVKDLVENKVTFQPKIYKLTKDFDAPGDEVKNAKTRPYAYFPVNLKQFEKVRKYLYTNMADPNDAAAYANIWPGEADPDNFRFRFPPASYDAYVLIGVGPRNHTSGMLVFDKPTNLSDTEWEDLKPYHYHINALRAYFRATRDCNKVNGRREGNGLLDFDYTNRAQGEGAEEGYLLPGPTGRTLWGPMIYKF